MKKSLFLTIALLAIGLVGCQTDPIDNSIEGSGETVLTATTAVTRTSLGEKSGDTYPVYWSEGDKIVVNGVQSEAAVINSADATNAQFMFVSIGMRNFVVKIGEYVDVPECVAKVLKQREERMEASESFVRSNSKQ